MANPMTPDPDPNLVGKFTATAQAARTVGVDPPCAATRQVKLVVNTKTGFVSVDQQGPIASGGSTSSNGTSTRSGVPPGPQGDPMEDEPAHQGEEGELPTGLTVDLATGVVGGVSVAILMAKAQAQFLKDPVTGANVATRDTTWTVTVTFCDAQGCCYSVTMEGGYDHNGANQPANPTWKAP